MYFVITNHRFVTKRRVYLYSSILGFHCLTHQNKLCFNDDMTLKLELGVYYEQSVLWFQEKTRVEAATKKYLNCVYARLCSPTNLIVYHDLAT